MWKSVSATCVVRRPAEEICWHRADNLRKIPFAGVPVIRSEQDG